jgi:hypothetical protein
VLHTVVNTIAPVADSCPCWAGAAPSTSPVGAAPLPLALAVAESSAGPARSAAVEVVLDEPADRMAPADPTYPPVVAYLYSALYPLSCSVVLLAGPARLW